MGVFVLCDMRLKEHGVAGVQGLYHRRLRMAMSSSSPMNSTKQSHDTLLMAMSLPLRGVYIHASWPHNVNYQDASLARCRLHLSCAELPCAFNMCLLCC